jgi:hypothetical protein
MTEEGVVYYRSGIRTGVGCVSRGSDPDGCSMSLSHAIGGSCDTESGITELD